MSYVRDLLGGPRPKPASRPKSTLSVVLKVEDESMFQFTYELEKLLSSQIGPETMFWLPPTSDGKQHSYQSKLVGTTITVSERVDGPGSYLELKLFYNVDTSKVRKVKTNPVPASASDNPV